MPEEQMHFQRSLSVFSRLAWLAQAARPLAGGSPSMVLGRNKVLQNSIAFAAFRQTGRMNKPVEFRETLARSLLQEHHPRVTERQTKVRPNPSIERTSTGLARSCQTLGLACSHRS
jgi:hypothetical protein